MNKPTIYILKGLPGSGKTTIAREMVQKADGNLKRINKDDLRAMLDNGQWSHYNERFIIEARDALISAALNAKKSVVVDDLNLNPKMEKGLRKAFGNRANFVVMPINTDVDECVRRDSLREGSARIGEEVIRDWHKKWENGWKDVDCTDVKAEFSVFEQDPALPHVAIFDIDGTLAHNDGHRGWYDWGKVGDDQIVDQVRQFAAMSWGEGLKIIIFSGRDEVCRPETEKWLAEHGIDYDELHMREEGTSHDDAIVKSDMLDEHITGKYYVEFIVDDRPKVCRMWRERGLFTFQVGDPHNEF